MPLFPVQLYVNDRGTKYYLTTSLTTTNKYMNGYEYRDMDLSRAENAEYTRRLIDLIDECQRYEVENEGLTTEQLKSGLARLCSSAGLTEEPKKKGKYLCDYIEEFGRSEIHSPGTVKLYLDAARKVRSYDSSATFESVTKDWLLRFERFMRQTMTTNGLAIVMRSVRATYNWAREDGITTNYPFFKYKIKSARTKKEVMSAQSIADFRDFEVDGFAQKYRDMFMLMVYLCGIDICDLCLLKKKDVRGGRLRFFRKKNACRENMVEVNIPITPCAQELIEKYKGKGEYLLDIMDERVTYDSFSRQMDKGLKKIGLVRIVPDILGKMRKVEYHPIFPGLTTKCARRTFVTIASRLGISEQLIGMALGHSWSASNTTQIYQWFGTEDQDKAIMRVLNHISALKGRSKCVILGEIERREGIG